MPKTPETKREVTELIHEELVNRFDGGFDNEHTINAIEFMTIALGNYFTTDELVGFYEFLKEE